jgi:MFS family permease
MDTGRLSRDVRVLHGAPGLRLYGTTAMAAAALVLMLVFNSANLPGPLYVIYRDRLHLSPITQSLIFAAYVLGAFAALIVLGRLSDQVGRRPVLFGAIVLSAVSTLLFIFAGGTAMLYAARAVSGLANGLVATACTAWMVELAPPGQKQTAAPLATAANVAALGTGPLLSGLLAQFAPAPLVLPYLVYLAGLLPPYLVVWTIHETVRSPKALRELSLWPRIGVPSEVFGQFVAPAVTAFVAFALMGFYSALVPNVLERALHIDNHAVGGAVIFFMFGSGVVAIAALRRLSSRAAMFTALALLIPGVLLLVLAENIASMPLLLAASALGGASGALGYRASLETINQIAPEDRRAETVAALLVACYAGISVPIIGVGVLSQLVNPTVADLVFAGVLCLLAIGAAIMGARYGAEQADHK